MYGSWGFLGDEQKMMTSPIYFHSFKSWRQTEAFVWETTPYLFFIFVFLIFYLFIFCLFILRLGIMMKNYLIIYCDENYLLLILNACLIKSFDLIYKTCNFFKTWFVLICLCFLVLREREEDVAMMIKLSHSQIDWESSMIFTSSTFELLHLSLLHFFFFGVRAKSKCTYYFIWEPIGENLWASREILLNKHHIKDTSGCQVVGG